MARELMDLGGAPARRPSAVSRALSGIPVGELDHAIDHVLAPPMRRQRAVELLCVVAQDTRIHVQLRVARALGALPPLRTDHLCAVARPLAASDRQTVRGAIARALGRQLRGSGQLSACEVLCHMSQEEDYRVRATAALVLARVGLFPGSHSILEGLAGDTYAEVRSGAVDAARVASSGGDGRATPVLAALARDNRRSVRVAAIRALGRVTPGGDGGETLAPLMDGALSLDDDTAEAAAEALASAARRYPARCLDLCESIVAQMEVVDPRALERLILPIAGLAPVEPGRSARLLGRLRDHEAPWLRQEAARAVTALRAAS